MKLEDNDGGTALYAITGAKPGDTKTSCIKVTYIGSLASTVKLFTPSTIGELGPYVNLKVEAGTQATSTFPNCEGFTVYTTGGTVYEGTLAAFATEHNTYATGISTFPTGQTKWETEQLGRLQVHRDARLVGSRSGAGQDDRHPHHPLGSSEPVAV